MTPDQPTPPAATASTSTDQTKQIAQLAHSSPLESMDNTVPRAAVVPVTGPGPVALVGHDVRYLDEETGTTVTGTVQSVAFGGNTPCLCVSGVDGIAATALRAVL
jgi:hypothetical protein